MDDKEFVEVWRKDFEELMRKTYPLHPLKRLPDDSAYINRDVFYLEQGFLLAKRSQPSVVLPKITQLHSANYIDGIQDCKACLTAAGIKYTIGE